MPNISLSRDIIAALFVACFALALVFLYKCALDERNAALQNAAIATEANKANKETIDVLEAEIIKRDELAAAWQEELAKEKKARDDARKELDELLEQTEAACDWSSHAVPDSVWMLLENNADSSGN